MDDLLDLDWKQPLGSSASKKGNGSGSIPNTNTSGISSGLSSSSSRPNYYASSPGPFSQPSRTAPNAAPTTTTINTASNGSSSSSTDAFSSLFASSNTAKPTANLSLAERQKQAQLEAAQKAAATKRQNDAMWSGLESSSWNTTNPVTSSSSSSIRTSSPLPPPISASKSPAPTAAPKTASVDAWDFDSFTSNVPKSTRSANATTAPTMPLGAASSPADPFDFDSFDQPTTTKGLGAASRVNDRSALDGDDDILGALAKPVDERPPSTNLLNPRRAALSKSAPSSSADSSRVPSPASGSRPTRRSAAINRSASPPPHIIGQIVEMGFSPQEAKRALAQTDSGIDVEAALEMLVGQAQGGSGHQDDDERLARQLQRQEEQQAREEAGGFRDSDDSDDDGHYRRGAESLRGSRVPSRSAVERPDRRANRDPRAAPHGKSAGHSPAPDAGADWQQQADQIYAQASEIGVSMLTKASAFWSSAKAQAQKALDERSKVGAERSNTPSDAGSERHRNRRWGVGGGAASAASRKQEWDGKPKWMQEAEALEAADDASPAQPAGPAAGTTGDPGGFKDSDDEDESMPTQPPQARRPPAPQGQSKLRDTNASLWDDAQLAVGAVPAATEVHRSVADRLAAPTDAGKKAYVSPNRRGPARSAAASPAPRSAAAPPSRAGGPLKQRPAPSDTASTVAAASSSKAQGNEHFRKGAYGEAEACYTRGISAFSSPDTIHAVPLLSNRANVRLKNGDAAGTIQDCDQLLSIVLSIFGGSERDVNGRIAVYRASREESLPADLSKDINLRETFGKTLVRRAQALEANEKWKLAKADWEVLLEYEKTEGSGVKTGASHIKYAREGLTRCGKMLGEKIETGTSATYSVPSSRRAGTSASSLSRGGAASKRAGTGAGAGGKSATEISDNFAAMQKEAAAEDAEKFSEKDAVDSKIEAWKSGKETNLRALLSSLDTILWPELNWKPIPLHQILDPNSLKKNYTKAIARLHPDKIARSATTHQKMIASAAFHALNEAWNAQQ